jgi:hypothetical protein
MPPTSACRRSGRRLFVTCDRLRPSPALDQGHGLPAPHAASILDAAGTWPARPLFTPRRAAATLERAQRGIAALGEGVPFLVVYYGSAPLFAVNAPEFPKMPETPPRRGPKSITNRYG